MNIAVKIIILILSLVLISIGIVLEIYHKKPSSKLYNDKKALYGGIALIILGVIGLIVFLMTINK